MPHSEHPIGTVLLALRRSGPTTMAQPLVTLKPNAVMRNVMIHYPEQTPSPKWRPTPGLSGAMANSAKS